MKYIKKKGTYLLGKNLRLKKDLVIPYRKLSKKELKGIKLSTEGVYLTTVKQDFLLLAGALFIDTHTLEEQVAEIMNFLYYEYGVTEDPLTMSAVELQNKVLDYIEETDDEN